MKRFKRIDCWISFILIPSFIIFGVAVRDTAFIAGYVVVGGWQIISIIVHFVNKWFTRKGELRFYYQRIIFILGFCLVAFLGIVKLFEFMYMLVLIPIYIMLFLSPFMAIFYAHICYEETYHKMKRPMELLK